MATTNAQFHGGDRVFSHYVMSYGTVVAEALPGVGSPRDGVWYYVDMDRGGRELLNDGGGNWDMARIVPPAVAVRYGYGPDPRA